MNEIQRLIQEMCPDGVPMVALGEVCIKITDGSHNPPTGIDNSSFRMISSQNIFNDKLVLNDIRFLKEEDFWKENRRTDVSQGDLLLTIVGAIGRCYVVKKEDLPFTCQRSIAVLKLNRTNVFPEYVHECIVNINSYLETQANGAAQKGLYLKQISKIQIPLPPLPIQRRIVEILDKFTSLVSSLDSEIALRQKQYEYYRNKLLTFEEGDEGVEWKKLRDVCVVINGRAYKQRELLDKGPYRVLRVGNFFSNDSWYYSDLELESKYYCDYGDLLYAWSASFGPHIWKEEKVIYHYHIWKLECQEPLDKKFMFYWLQSEYMTSQVLSEKHGATMAHLTKAMMEDLTIPIPPKSVQRSIVQTLDTFESLLANLKKERELRQKQYEYYREKLLTFE